MGAKELGWLLTAIAWLGAPTQEGSAGVEAPQGLERELQHAEQLASGGPTAESCAAAVSLVERVGPEQAGVAPVQRVRLGELLLACGSYREALQVHEWHLAEVRGRREPGHAELLDAMTRVALCRGQLGDYEGALALYEEIVNAMEADPSFDDGNRLTAYQNVASALGSMGRLEESRAIEERLLAEYPEKVGADHPALARTRQSLAVTLFTLGEFRRARELFEQTVEALEPKQGPDAPDVLDAKMGIAKALEGDGDLRAAAEVGAEVVAACERTLPPDHPQLLNALQNHAGTLLELGETARATALLERALEGLERTFGSDSPQTIAVRGNLSNALSDAGDLPRAIELGEEVLASYERTLPAGHPRIAMAHVNVGASLARSRRLGDAREHFERALESFAATLPEDDPRRLTVTQNLAGVRYLLGDLVGARELFEQVLAQLEARLPAQHPEVSRARSNLASVRRDAGDFMGALRLEELVLEGRIDLHGEDDPRVDATRLDLALTLRKLGDEERALAVAEEVLTAREDELPDDDLALASAREAVAMTAASLGDLDRAASLFAQVAAAREAHLPEGHPNVLVSLQNLAMILSRQGEFEQALELVERAHEGYARILPPDHHDRLMALENRIIVLAAAGEAERARALLPELLDGIQAAVQGALSLSPRELGALIARQHERLLIVVHLLDGAPPEVATRLFEVLESLRIAAQVPAVPGRDPELEELVAESARLRQELQATVSGDLAGQELEQRLGEVAFERDRVDRELRSRLHERTGLVTDVRAADVAAALSPGSAWAGLFTLWSRPPPPAPRGTRRLLAFVVRPDAPLAWRDLGDADELGLLAQTWRDSLGGPVGRGVGIGAPAGEAHDAARELFERIGEPLLELAGGAELRSLHVGLDDFLHLVPLDALPVGEAGEVLGDRVRVLPETSLARLLTPAAATPDVAPSLFVVGAVDFDAEPAGAPLLPGAAAPVEMTRSAGAGSFAPLSGTAEEVQALADLFRSTFDREPVLLLAAAAQKSRLFEAASGATYVHVATHGWFAGEQVLSTGDRDHGFLVPYAPDSAASILGFAPMTLCGLALAGANRGRDSLGRVPGILTAEELCAVDLSSCELAVLSACETNVGIRRAGQGIQSLQAALHAAGARTAVTSLWKVDDAATRELMERFYTFLWKDGLPKAEALWKAKCALRERGAPLRDWAGWVMTGDPD